MFNNHKLGRFRGRFILTVNCRGHYMYTYQLPYKPHNIMNTQNIFFFYYYLGVHGFHFEVHEDLIICAY